MGGNAPRRAAQPDAGHRRHRGLHCPGWAGGDLRHDRPLLGLLPGHPCRQTRHARLEALEPVRQAVREQFGGFTERHCPGREAPSRARLPVPERRLSARDPLPRPGVLTGIRPRAGRQRLHGTFLPHPQGAASLGQALRHAGGVGRSPGRIPASLQRAVAHRTDPLTVPTAGSSGSACPGELPHDDNSKNRQRNRRRYNGYP